MQISQSIDFFPTICFTQLLSGSSSMKYINLVTPLAFTAEKLAIEESGFLVHCMFNVDTLSRWRHAHFETFSNFSTKSTLQNSSKISQIITNKCISLHKKFVVWFCRTSTYHRFCTPAPQCENWSNVDSWKSTKTCKINQSADLKPFAS